MEFKHGAFTIAKEAKVQILPIYVHGCQDAHNPKWVCGPAELTLVYGNPFDVLEDSAQLPHAESGTQIHPFEKTRKEVKEWMEKHMKALARPIAPIPTHSKNKM
jgi:1-acyl-sn-glycerol-3-phosphate acyltransferase